MNDLPGRGDYEYWPCSGHPMDPRSGPSDYLNDDEETDEDDCD